MKLINKTSRKVLLEKIRFAKTPWARFKGLLFTQNLPKNQGLWLIPCNSVHMFGMRYPIDVLFLDRNNRVIHKIAKLKPNRISPIIFKAKSVIEFPAAWLQKHSVSIHDHLEAA